MTAPLRRARAARAPPRCSPRPPPPAPHRPEPPMTLPGDAAAASVRAARSTWIVGARPGAASRALARRFGARRVGPAGTGGYVVARASARAFAGALRRARAARLRAAGHARPAAPGGPGRPAVGPAGRLAREGRQPGAGAAAGDADEPADRARRRAARRRAPRVRRRAHDDAAAVPGHDLPRHGDRLGRGGAGQRHRDRRRLARRAGAERAAAAPTITCARLGERDHARRSRTARP